jgi:hypothetical protein
MVTIPVWTVLSIIQDFANKVQILIFLMSPGRSACSLLNGRFSRRMSNLLARRRRHFFF